MYWPSLHGGGNEEKWRKIGRKGRGKIIACRIRGGHTLGEEYKSRLEREIYSDGRFIR